MARQSAGRPTAPASAAKAKGTRGRATPKTDASLGLVTIVGGSGFIGRSLTRRLVDAGHTVRIASRHGKAPGIEGDAAAKVEAAAASILSDEQVNAAVAGADAVVNLVGILYESGEQTFEAVHTEGARRVADACRSAGVRRLVHMSALGADPASPSAYARTKANGEQAVHGVFPEASILRPSIVFGPEDDFFNRFASMGRFAPALPLIGGGRTRFQPVFVDDVARAIERILVDDATKGRIYELGGPRAYTFKELLELLVRQKKWTRLLLPVPFFVAEIQGSLLQHLPTPPLTRDQVELLKTDNVVSGTLPGLSDLGIEPTPVEEILPTYL